MVYAPAERAEKFSLSRLSPLPYSVVLRNIVSLSSPWMKEVKGIRHRGRGVYLRCPVFTTVQFSLRDEGSSEYICLCEGREILSPNFQTFQDPRHQFHGIGRLVSETLYLFATLALLHIQAELILGTFLLSLKV